MTKFTSVYKLPSPDLVESADGPLGFSNLANATETALIQVRKAFSTARYRGADFGMASGTTLLNIALDQLEWNNGFTFAATNSYPIIPVTGYYLVVANAVWVNQAGGERQVAIARGATAIGEAVTTTQYATANRYTTCNVSYVGLFTKNTDVRLQAAQSSGKLLTCTSARMSINLLSYT